MRNTQTTSTDTGEGRQCAAVVGHDIIAEGALSITGASRRVPVVDGKHPNPSTIFRWIMTGLNGIRLEHLRVGRRIVTSEAALKRFFAALAQAKAAEVKPAFTPRARGDVRSEQKRLRAVAEAERRLSEAGI